jgi:hypothetical protein
MLKRLFIVNTQKDRPWYKVVLWWELRRILYNIILLISGIIALTILGLIVKDLTSFFSPPIFFFMATGVFIVVANIFYTLSWIFQLITLNSSNRFNQKITPRLLIYGIAFSFLIQLIPSISAATYTIVTGERIKSQYADFATEEPKKEDLIGEYTLSEVSIIQLDFPDSLINKASYKFNPDMTFEFFYYPEHDLAMSLTEYEIVTAKGTWKIEKDQGTWVIPMDFDTIKNLKTGIINSKGMYHSNGFKVNKEEPPYEIYKIIGDPDSWEGITLVKK